MQLIKVNVLWPLIAASFLGCGAGAASDVVARSADLVSAACGQEVVRYGAVISVSPSAVEDTANLQCAIDAAIATGAGAIVQLDAGTFRTGQIVAKNFRGTLRGRGTDRTLISNPSRVLSVTRDNWFAQDPSATNPWPALFAFVDGDFTVSDLAVHVAGNAPTTEWTLFGSHFTAVNYAFVVLGTAANARFDHLDVRGAPAPQANGVNLNLAIFYSGFSGFPAAPPLSGRIEVSSSTFRFLSGPATIFSVRNANVRVAGNQIEDVQIGPAVVQVTNVRSMVSSNHIAAQFAGFQSFGGVTDSTLLVAGNRITAFDGVELLSDFAGRVDCAVLANDTSTSGGAGVVLGPGTRNCLVANSGTVVDHGTDNRIATR